MANDYAPYQDAWQPDNTSKYFGGVVRLLSTGPDILHDGPHVSIGLRSVSIASSGLLEVEHDGTLPVGRTIVQVDETLAARGILVGPSEAGSVTRIRFYRVGTGALDLNNATHYGYVSGSTSNIWIDYNFPLHRGSGSPTPTDLNTFDIADLKTAVDELRARIEALESFHPILIFDETEFQ